MTPPLSAFYEYVGISRQGISQHIQRQKQWMDVVSEVIAFAKDVRVRHPRMGARKIYILMSKSTAYLAWLPQVGRDKVEAILLNNGFGVKVFKSYHKTTRSGLFRVENLLKDFISNNLLTTINQVWVSDITYYIVVENGNVKHYYLTFIMDLYSRAVLGFAVSDRMTAEETCIKAFEGALKYRKITQENQLEGLLFHSDGGGQYLDGVFRKKLAFYGAISSMAKEVYENPNAEKLNDTVKNYYLIPWGVNSLQQLGKRTPEAIFYYNNEKPHDGLKGLTPAEFEKMI